MYTLGLIVDEELHFMHIGWFLYYCSTHDCNAFVFVDKKKDALGFLSCYRDLFAKQKFFYSEMTVKDYSNTDIRYLMDKNITFSSKKIAHADNIKLENPVFPLKINCDKSRFTIILRKRRKHVSDFIRKIVPRTKLQIVDFSDNFHSIDSSIKIFIKPKLNTFIKILANSFRIIVFDDDYITKILSQCVHCPEIIVVSNNMDHSYPFVTPTNPCINLNLSFTKISPNNDPVIPYLIHFLWLDEKKMENAIPKKYTAHYYSFVRLNPDFEIRIWNEDQAVQHLKQYPCMVKTYLPFYFKLNHRMKKCDFLRLCLIYVCGGMYCDLDFFCLRPIRNLFQEFDLMFFYEPDEHNYYSHPKLIMNSTFASVPFHSVIKQILQYLIQNYKPATPLYQSTGPLMVTSFFMKHPSYDKYLFSHYLTSPLTFQHLFSKGIRQESYLFTLWTDGTGWGNKNLEMYHLDSEQSIQTSPFQKKPILLILICSFFILLLSFFILSH